MGRGLRGNLIRSACDTGKPMSASETIMSADAIYPGRGIERCLCLIILRHFTDQSKRDRLTSLRLKHQRVIWHCASSHWNLAILLDLLKRAASQGYHLIVRPHLLELNALNFCKSLPIRIFDLSMSCLSFYATSSLEAIHSLMRLWLPLARPPAHHFPPPPHSRHSSPFAQPFQPMLPHPAPPLPLPPTS